MRLCGERDRANKKAALELRDGIPGAELAWVPGAGHEVNREAPEALAALLEAVRAGGINYIDTARGYTVSEELIGQAIEGHRQAFVLATKSMARDREAMDSISANVSANLLGLGSAATPLGLEAARRLARSSPGTASDSLCMLVVCNTASIQLIPTTVASVRAAEGCQTPFDILPAVWLASALSVGVGIAACKLFSKIWRD